MECATLCSNNVNIGAENNISRTRKTQSGRRDRWEEKENVYVQRKQKRANKNSITSRSRRIYGKKAINTPCSENIATNGKKKGGGMRARPTQTLPLPAKYLLNVRDRSRSVDRLRTTGKEHQSLFCGVQDLLYARYKPCHVWGD